MALRLLSFFSPGYTDTPYSLPQIRYLTAPTRANGAQK
jgi:hypothetical protein